MNGLVKEAILGDMAVYVDGPARTQRSPAEPYKPRGLAAGVAAILSGELSPSEWAEECLTRAAAVENECHAFAALNANITRGAAAEIDNADWDHWRPAPLLAGAPVAVKDIFNTKDLPTGMGSAVRAGFMPGNDARIVSQLKLRGGLVMGKTETAEFAVHTPGRGVNPRSSDHIPGTSSTGSAIAVATGSAPLALGTQTAGSILRPASYNGVVGFKPSFGMVPRTGVLKTCDTLDTIGWLTRNVADAKLAFEALRIDGHNYPMLQRGRRAAAARYPAGRPWRLALANTPGMESASDYARDALVEFALQLGNRPDIDLIELDLTAPLQNAHEIHRKIYHKSLSYYFTRELHHLELISDIFIELVEEGSRISTDEYRAALAEQQTLADHWPSFIADADAIITLTVAGEPPKLDQSEPRDACLIWTLLGAPSISLPNFSGPNGLPYGVQLSAPRYHDFALLDLAALIFPGDSTIALAA